MPKHTSVHRNRFVRPVESLERRTLLSSSMPLDAAFGDGGQTLVDVFAKADIATEIAVQADGKIVVAGESTRDLGDGNGADWIGVVARFNADGTLDTTFGGGDGIVVTEALERIDSMTLTADGKILLGGEIWQLGEPHTIAVARYNADGSLDTTFGDGGDGFTHVATGGVFNEGLREIAVAPDGRIVGVAIANSHVGFDQGDFGVIRFNADGTLDTTFGAGSGFVTTDFSDAVHSADIANAVAFHDGKLIVGGATINHGGENAENPGGGFAMARYNGDGTLDMGFDDNGMVITRFADGDPTDWVDWGSGNVGTLLVTPAGKLVAVGYSSMGSLTLARYNADDGSIDTTFADDGFRYINDGVAHNIVNWQARLRADGDIDVAAAGGTAVAGGTLDGEDGTGEIAIGRVPTTDAILTYDKTSANGVTWNQDGNLVAAGHGFPGAPPTYGNNGAGWEQADFAVMQFGDAQTDPPPPPPPPGTVYAPGTGRVEVVREETEDGPRFHLVPGDADANSDAPAAAANDAGVYGPAPAITTKVKYRKIVRKGEAFTFRAIFRSDEALTLDNIGNVYVEGPNGYHVPAEASNVKQSKSGTRLTATFTAEAPGGDGFTFDDNGSYSIVRADAHEIGPASDTDNIPTITEDQIDTVGVFNVLVAAPKDSQHASDVVDSAV